MACTCTVTHLHLAHCMTLCKTMLICLLLSPFIFPCLRIVGSNGAKVSSSIAVQFYLHFYGNKIHCIVYTKVRLTEVWVFIHSEVIVHKTVVLVTTNLTVQSNICAFKPLLPYFQCLLVWISWNAGELFTGFVPIALTVLYMLLIINSLHYSAVPSFQTFYFMHCNLWSYSKSATGWQRSARSRDGHAGSPLSFNLRRGGGGTILRRTLDCQSKSP